jgi:Mrp family chromosome partitioning ATPase
MARIRDALREGRKNGERLPSVAALAPEEEIPFIEVGGKGMPLEASPSVLAAGRDHTPVYPVLKPASPASVLTEKPARVRGLAFRPLTAELIPARPPALRFARELVAFHQPDDPVSQQYLALAETLAAQFSGARSQVLFFTAAVPQAGTTTVLLNLAVTRVLHAGAKIAAIEANVQRPALAVRLGLADAPGLSDVLTGAASLQGALQETGLDNFQVLTAGEGREGRCLALGGEPVRAVLRHLRDLFDWVLVDGPAWDGSADQGALAAACDAVYLVVPEGQADAPQTEKLFRLIPQQESRLRGCIVVQAE